MEVLSTSLPDVKILVPTVFKDHRGFFLESYQKNKLAEKAEINELFVQDNLSHSNRHVLRGLHYQIEHSQGKLVSVIKGEAFDVAVDLRKNSPTFGQWVGILLSEINHHMVWIPKGFAHGFLALSETVDFLYKATDFYDPHSEQCLRWDDPDLAIEWPIQGKPLLSEKDQQGKSLKEATIFL